MSRACFLLIQAANLRMLARELRERRFLTEAVLLEFRAERLVDEAIS